MAARSIEAAVRDALMDVAESGQSENMNDIDGKFSGLPPAAVRDEPVAFPLQHPPLAHAMGRAW